MYALSIYKARVHNFLNFFGRSTCIYGEMGRGRNYGPVDQSTKKTKLSKNKKRGNLQLFNAHRIEENTELPILVSEELLAEMKKMSPQELMNYLLPDNANNGSSTSEKKNVNFLRA